MTRPVLVTGFGAFLDVVDNPSARLARELDGRVVAGAMCVGHVLPVTYVGGPALAVRLARALDAQLVLGIGVARRRLEVQVERWGTRALGKTPDIDGQCPTDLGEGPDRVEATLDPARLASLLDGSVSEDAGGYVCNAWAWAVPSALQAPAAFIHVPPSGMPASKLLHAIERLLS